MKEQLISFETAKLAKEKGFNIPTLYGYNIKEEVLQHIDYASYSPGEPEILITDFIKSWEYQAPTQSLLQKWLREEHEIHIEIYRMSNHFKCRIVGKDDRFGDDDIYRMREYHRGLQGNTYEEALEKGLQEALKLI